ncbi:copper chaperone PCu(A)C [Albimonas sp. CAU 1670]|uniref:copper chaperone PCu(A)C n=1 Tax=Albimonas sp. CAU 1670 TaxID=3032599 RepID=UPI0023DAABA8|nr:copper chaperone PCu(A)C [Albimonas sp. CAU 1670]MDF2233230.1 copper chaperone PCu(A)C [Albimonas sp. CAU 1670]
MTRTLSAAALAALFAFPALAADVSVADAYARSANPKVAGAFLVLVNHGDAPVKLVDARSDVASKVELHTHVMQDGIAKMRQVEAMEIPAHGEHRLQRGGDHVMMMGVHEPLKQGDVIAVTLVFDDGDTLDVEIPVDNERQDMPAMDHGKMNHGTMKPTN